MKKTIRILGIIALTAVIGFTFVACAEPSITISGNAKVGGTITATSEGGTFESDFMWELSAKGGEYDWSDSISYIYTNVSGSNKQNCEIRTGAEERYIRASRRTDRGDTIYSNVLGPIASY